MKKLLLIILLLTQPIYADLNGMSKLIIPEDIVCYETEPLFGMDIEREIAEFEAKAKLPKFQPTVCEPNRGSNEAYILGIKN